MDMHLILAEQSSANQLPGKCKPCDAIKSNSFIVDFFTKLLNLITMQAFSISSNTASIRIDYKFSPKLAKKHQQKNTKNRFQFYERSHLVLLLPYNPFHEHFADFC